MHDAHTSLSTKLYNKHCIVKDCLNTVMGECDRKPRLVVGGKVNLHGNAAQRANVTEP